MVLVLFLLGFFLLLAIFSFLILLSTLKVEIETLRIDNTEKIEEDQEIQNKILFYIGLYVFREMEIITNPSG